MDGLSSNENSFRAFAVFIFLIRTEPSNNLIWSQF